MHTIAKLEYCEPSNFKEVGSQTAYRACSPPLAGGMNGLIYQSSPKSEAKKVMYLSKVHKREKKGKKYKKRLDKRVGV